MRPTALVFSGFVVTCALGISAAASASEGAKPRVAHLQRVAHHRVLPASAEALSPATPTFRPFDDSDGLSRDTGQCNTGCIDN